MGRDPGRAAATGRGAALARLAVRLCLLALAALAIHRFAGWAAGLPVFGNGGARTGMLLLFLLAYALLIAVPFVPGVELGLSLMVAEGPRIVPGVYLATVLGLSLAYAAGEWIPYRRLHRLLSDLRLDGAGRLLAAVAPLDRQARLDLLADRAPTWLRPMVVRYRHVLIAALINLPGSAVIGGGGGIMFAAGLSRLFRPLPMLLTVALAVAPVPLAVWAFDLDLARLFG